MGKERLSAQMQDQIHKLQRQGHGIREISRMLKVFRNTIRRLMRAKSDADELSIEP